MATAKGPIGIVQTVRALTYFVVGVRHVHEGEEFSADDPLVIELPSLFEPVLVGESGPQLETLPAGGRIVSARDMAG